MATRDAAKPKHLLLFEELGQAIERGTFGPGQRLPTEAELMQRYGVSRTTVTRTLRDLEHRGVIWRRRGSGTFVKEVERAPVAAEQFGMIVHGIEPGSVFLDVYEALVRAADRTSAQLRLANESAEAAEVSAKRMIDAGVRGVFYLPHSIPDQSDAGNHGDLVNRRVTELLAAARVPVVLLDRDVCNFPRRSTYDLVSVDNSHGGYLLGQHMIDAGCRRPIFFAENGIFSSVRARWAGFRAAMEANGVEATSVQCDPDSAADVMRIVRQHKPDGIVCDNDRHAAMVMRHLLNAKVSVPAEVKLAGFDDTPTASLLAVPLTTVRQPGAAIAVRALSLMNDRLAHPHLPPAHVSVHCELIVRESTVPGAAAPAGQSAALAAKLGQATPRNATKR